ncbi:hypothetical protein KXV85_002938, partial [Aspergillus fumigatus]
PRRRPPARSGRLDHPSLAIARSGAGHRAQGPLDPALQRPWRNERGTALGNHARPQQPRPATGNSRAAHPVYCRGRPAPLRYDRAIRQQELGAADHRRRAADRASRHARQRAADPRHRDAGRAGALGRCLRRMEGAQHARHSRLGNPRRRARSRF